MGRSYPAEAGPIYMCEDYGGTGFHPNIIANENGNGTEARRSGVRGGITRFTTAGAAGNSKYHSWGVPHQPAIRRPVVANVYPAPRPLEPCMGDAYIAVRAGLTSLAACSFLVGWVEETETEALGNNEHLGTIAGTYAANGVLTSPANARDFAGILFHGGLSDTPAELRAVSRKTLDISEGNAKTGFSIKADADDPPLNVDPDVMPEYRVSITTTGDVHVSANGLGYTVIKEAVDPTKSFVAFWMLTTHAAAAKIVDVDYTIYSNTRWAGVFPPY